MYYVGFKDSRKLIKLFDRDGIISTISHSQALCFETEYAAWQFLLLIAGCCDYDVCDLFVEYISIEEEN